MKYVLGIIIPYYKNSNECEEYFKNLMETLNYQILNHQEAILCVVEDGQYSKWLDKYKNDRIIILRNTENKGVSITRNVGIGFTINNCLYLSFIDSDDYISEDYINVLIEYCQDNTHDLIETNVFINKTLVEEMPKDKLRSSVWGYAIKSELIKNKRFEDKKQIGEDTCFINEVIDLTKHRKKHCNCVYYYQYGVNPNSLIKRYNNKEIGKER